MTDTPKAAACEHRNWFAMTGQPAKCTDCGMTIPTQIPPPKPPKLRRIK
jgi:hypothetical protein